MSNCTALILPILDESNWHVAVRATLYLVAMLWFFLGIAIVADTFMCAIEKITSKTRIVKIADSEVKGGTRDVEVKVWNDTVANLSLLAFGTSAPEILLNVIEICGNKFVAGELGPGTIVGSAAFNLLAITAVCIICIPKNEIRRIELVPVYVVTSIFNLLSYVWLALVLMVITPNVVTLWEAIVTFLFFPMLILVSYAVDKRICCKRSNKTSSEVEIGIGPKSVDDYDENGEHTHAEEERAEIIHLAKELGRNRDLTEEKAAKLAAAKIAQNEHHSSVWYKVNARRGLTGGHKLLPQINSRLKELYDNVKVRQSQILSDVHSTTSINFIDLSDGGSNCVIEFTASSCAVLENEGKVRIGIKRYGKMDTTATVLVETIDGTAEAGSDYKPIKEYVEFSVNEALREVYIEIIDDDIWEPDEFFFVKLHLPEEKKQHDVVLGKVSINQVTIINDDEPGKFEFSKPSYIVRESNATAQVIVNRVNGADGEVSVNWKTTEMSAKHNVDFVGGEGDLTFKHGETSKTVSFAIMDSELPERDHSFQVELNTPTGGAELGKIPKTIVTLVTDAEFDGLVSRIANQTKQNLEGIRLDTSSWKQQFHEAMNVNGGDIDEASSLDYVMHFLSFFWKVFFACIPPTGICGGWLTFVFSLLIIGLLTAVVADLATIVGCLLGIKPTVTAITFVALGTSMPDTFASKVAAINEKSADCAIGNINGSNAVNVFLGLGLPWLLAASYWEAKDTTFEYKAGSLGFSVVIYLSVAFVAIAILFIRRKIKIFGNAELGGPVKTKWITGIIIFMLWIFYIVISSLESYSIVKGF